MAKDYYDEDTMDMFEAKEKAYNEGFGNGILMGIPVGTAVTIIIGWLTKSTWLQLIQ